MNKFFSNKNLKLFSKTIYWKKLFIYLAIAITISMLGEDTINSLYLIFAILSLVIIILLNLYTKFLMELPKVILTRQQIRKQKLKKLK